jgi:hypothetical protein
MPRLCAQGTQKIEQAERVADGPSYRMAGATAATSAPIRTLEAFMAGDLTGRSS